MGFDFAAWPPELIAALIKAGAGAAPMMSAATSWQDLAAELEQAAAAYQSVISELGSTWHGPSSTSMAGAAGQYIEWLQQTAAAAQQAGIQALSSAVAYETASNTIVPLPVIEANRAELQTLIATNFLGVNTPAILATEAAYAAMWATNSAAMYAYSAASGAASELMPMSPAPQNTNPGGSLTQAAAAPAGSTQSGLNSLIGQLQGSINQLSSSAAGTSATSPASGLLGGIDSFLGNTVVADGINNSVYSAAWWFPMMATTIPSLAHTLANAPAAATAAADATTPAALGAGLATGSAGPIGGVGSLGGNTGVLASMGQSSTVGGMAVPGGWAQATPDVGETVTLTGSSWASEPEMGGVNAVPAGIPAAASAGRGGYGFGGPRYGVKPTVMPKQVFA